MSRFDALSSTVESAPESSSTGGSNPPVSIVELDGLVVLKIIKHCQQALPTFVTGQLLGLDIGRTLEVTSAFPFPGKDSGESEDDSADYQMEMMRCLREVNVDNNTVGWYQSTYFSSFIDESCIETQVGCPAREASSRRAFVRRAGSAGSAVPARRVSAETASGRGSHCQRRCVTTPLLCGNVVLLRCGFSACRSAPPPLLRPSPPIAFLPPSACSSTIRRTSRIASC